MPMGDPPDLPDTVSYGGGPIPYNARYVHQSYGIAFALTRQMVDEQPSLSGFYDRINVTRRANRTQIFHDIEPEDL